MAIFLIYICFMAQQSNLEEKINTANEVITKAYDMYGQALSFCFNGGKDSTVLLDLVIKEAKKRGHNIRPFYLEVDHEFSEILDFMAFSEKYWSFEIIRIKADNMKQGLDYLVKNYGVKAVFLGVRLSDFHNIKMNFFEKTTPGWPDAMRVMPLLNWTYHDIWNYIEKYNIPCCSLYENVYTSIGSIEDTKPNPALYDEETKQYKHAKMLSDENLERFGRIMKK